MTKRKKGQKLIQGLYPTHMHISRPWRKHVQSFKKIGIKLYEEFRSQGTHCLYTLIESEVKKWQSSQSGKLKWQKLMQGLYPNYMHIFRLWRKHVQSFKKIGIKLWWVALTRYPLSIHWGKKMTKFTKMEKVTKNNLTIISKPHAHPHTMTKTHAKFQKDRYKTVRGVALTRHPG